MATVSRKTDRSRGPRSAALSSDDPAARPEKEEANAALVETPTKPVASESALVAAALLAGVDPGGDKPDRRRLRDRRDPAGERDLAGDRRDHAGDLRDRAGDRRDHAGDRRDHAGDLRDRAGGQRDQTAHQRDQAAEQRDQAADKRDMAADDRGAWLGAGNASDALDRSTLARRSAASDRKQASQDRGAAAIDRRQAELDRTAALADRGTGAGERRKAELDRNVALADRGVSASEREDASVDLLTGVLLRRPGFVSLKRALRRAKHKKRPLVLAFVDVDHLKAINDSLGHAAGDQMLVEVADTLRANLRAYDRVVRYGGDEFVFAIAGLNVADGKSRVALVNAALAEASEHGSVTVGLAQLQPDDSLNELVARADAALYQARQDRD